MRKIFAILLLALIGFLLAIAFYPPLKDAVVSAFYTYGGGTAQAIGGWWGGIIVNPLYQQYHVLIWFVGGMVTTVAFIMLKRKNKIPLLKSKPKEAVPSMGQPQTIIIRETPVTTGTVQVAKQATGPVDQAINTPIGVNEPEKAAAS